MADEKTTAPVVIAPKSSDELAKELFDKVQTERAAIAQAEKPNWETNGLFRFNTESPANVINIQTTTDDRKLVEIHAFICRSEEGFKTSATELGVSNRFTWLSHYASEWKKDIKTRIDQLQLSEKKRKFAALEEKLQRLLTPEQQKALELAAIQKELAGA